MPDNSFDVVSKIDMPEVVNAIQQSDKEIITRFDLKDSKSRIELNEKDNKITVSSKDEFKLKVQGIATTAEMARDSMMRAAGEDPDIIRFGH